MTSNTNQYKDIYGRWHAPLMNAYNNYCWYITGLQRLQCSQTLENLLKSGATLSNNISDEIRTKADHIIQPIKIMNKLNETNGKDVVDELRTYFEAHSKTYHSTDGFSTNVYISKYILPIIYNLSGNDIPTTIQIMKEIGMDSASMYVANEVISNKQIPIMNFSEESDFLSQVYKPFHETFVEYIKKNPFKPEVYSSTDVQLWSPTRSGHVIPCIQTPEGKWIVFDDHRFVGEVKDYLGQPYNFHKVKFALTDDSFKSFMEQELNAVSRNINNFKIIETLAFFTLENKNEYRVKTAPLTIAGGGIKGGAPEVNSSDKDPMRKLYYFFAFVVIILAIILIMIVRKIGDYMRHRCVYTYDELISYDGYMP